MCRIKRFALSYDMSLFSQLKVILRYNSNSYSISTIYINPKYLRQNIDSIILNQNFDVNLLNSWIHEMTRQRKSSKTIASMFSWSFPFIESTSIASTDGRTTRVMTKPKPRSVITKIRAWSNSEHFKFTWNNSWVMILVLQILIFDNSSGKLFSSNHLCSLEVTPVMVESRPLAQFGNNNLGKWCRGSGSGVGGISFINLHPLWSTFNNLRNSLQREGLSHNFKTAI